MYSLYLPDYLWHIRGIDSHPKRVMIPHEARLHTSQLGSRLVECPLNTSLAILPTTLPLQTSNSLDIGPAR